MFYTRTKTLWSITRPTDVVVVPTSVGWRDDGRAVFGMGLLRQVARRWPHLPTWYGQECRDRCGKVPVIFWTVPRPARPGVKQWCGVLCLLPVRPLMKQKPHLSWLPAASEEMIVDGLAHIKQAARTSPPDMRFIVPFLGSMPSDKHKLAPDKVKALLDDAKLDDRFILVEAEDA